MKIILFIIQSMYVTDVNSVNDTIRYLTLGVITFICLSVLIMYFISRKINKKNKKEK